VVAKRPPGTTRVCEAKAHLRMADVHAGLVTREHLIGKESADREADRAAKSLLRGLGGSVLALHGRWARLVGLVASIQAMQTNVLLSICIPSPALQERQVQRASAPRRGGTKLSWKLLDEAARGWLN